MRDRNRLGLAVVWSCIAVVLVVLLWSTWTGPDVFYRLALGRAVVETGAFQPPDRLLIPQTAYCNVYWLFQVVLWGIWSFAGAIGVSLVFVALWVAVFVLWARTAGLHLHPAVGVPLALAVVLVVHHRFEPRPEVVSYLILAAQVGWLSRWRPELKGLTPTLVFFVLTEALWVNVHGYFVLGPAVVGIRLAAAVLTREGWPVVRRVAVLLGLTVLATMVSPFGLGGWRFVLTLAVFLGEMRAEIAEFGPPIGVFLQQWTVWLFWLLWVVSVVAAVWLAARRRLEPFSALLAGIGLLLSASSVRNLPLLPMLAAPLWREVLVELKQPVRFKSAQLLIPLAAVVSLVLAASVVTGGFYSSLRSERSFGVGLASHAYPARAVRYLDANRGAGRLLNSAADGGYLEFYHPELRVCMDSRYVEAGPVRRYFTALRAPAAFSRLDADLHFDAALLKVVDSGQVVVQLMRDRGWVLVWGDLHRVLFVRRHSSLVRSWSRAGIHLEQGDDLGSRVHGMAAIQWIAILIEAGDRGRLVRVLRQLADAERVPSFVIQYALQYALMKNDPEVLELGRKMAPRMVALAPEHRQAVEQLLVAARGR